MRGARASVRKTMGLANGGSCWMSNCRAIFCCRVARRAAPCDVRCRVRGRDRDVYLKWLPYISSTCTVYACVYPSVALMPGHVSCVWGAVATRSAGAVRCVWVRALCAPSQQLCAVLASRDVAIWPSRIAWGGHNGWMDGHVSISKKGRFRKP